MPEWNIVYDLYPPHHHIQPFSIHCCIESSPFSFHISQSAAILIHVAPEKRLISSTYLAFGRRLSRFFSRGIQCSTFVVHLPSVRLAMWPAHFHFSFFVVLITSPTFICARIHSFVFLSLLVIPSMHLSIALCETLKLWVICAFNVQVSQPYIITGNDQQKWSSSV